MSKIIAAITQKEYQPLDDTDVADEPCNGQCAHRCACNQGRTLIQFNNYYQVGYSCKIEAPNEVGDYSRLYLIHNKEKEEILKLTCRFLKDPELEYLEELTGRDQGNNVVFTFKIRSELKFLVMRKQFVEIQDDQGNLVGTIKRSWWGGCTFTVNVEPTFHIDYKLRTEGEKHYIYEMKAVENSGGEFKLGNVLKREDSPKVTVELNHNISASNYVQKLMILGFAIALIPRLGPSKLKAK